MYEGHVTFGSAEVVNTERLQAYVDHGVVPPGVVVDACSECEELAAALDPGLVPYRTPLLDIAPWVDLDDPDTFDFTGLLPIEITGVDNTTATVTMTETLNGRAVPGRRSRAPRQIGVTALLTGRTTEGVQAGLRWLTDLLQRTCEDDPGCAGGADIEMFTVCPTPIYPQPDLSADQVETDFLGWGDETANWTPVNGEYVEYPDDPSFTNLGLFTPIIGNEIDGGDPAGTVDPPLDGGTPEGGWDSPEVYDGGDPGPFAGEGFGLLWNNLHLPIQCWETWIGFVLRLPDGATDPVNITLVLMDSITGEVIEEGPQVVLDGLPVDPDFPGWETFIWVLPSIEHENWGFGFYADGPVVNAGGAILTQPPLPAESCLAPYRRILPSATLTSGPTITKRLPIADCAEWLQVEWIWTAGSPYRYGTVDKLIENLGFLRNATTYGVGVTSGLLGGPEGFGIDSSPWNCTASSDDVTCAVDPCNPGWVDPPASPVVPDPTFATISGTDTINHAFVCIDASRIPSGEGVLVIKLESDDQPKVGVRVRIYDDVQAGPVCSVTDECDFAAEYLIDYIPANGVVTIDGVAGTITTLCPGFAEPQATPVRGDFGGPVKEPVVGCDKRTMVVVQYLHDYPRDCEGFYTAGEYEGTLWTNVSIATREG